MPGGASLTVVICQLHVSASAPGRDPFLVRHEPARLPAWAGGRGCREGAVPGLSRLGRRPTVLVMSLVLPRLHGIPVAPVELDVRPRVAVPVLVVQAELRVGPGDDLLPVVAELDDAPLLHRAVPAAVLLELGVRVGSTGSVACESIPSRLMWVSSLFRPAFRLRSPGGPRSRGGRPRGSGSCRWPRRTAGHRRLPVRPP